MAGRFGRNKYKKNHEEFEEEDVWGVMEVSNLKPMMMMIQPDYSSPANPSSSSPRMIPRSSSSSSMNDGCNRKQFSAPVDIPDWSKIYGKGTRKKAPSVMPAPSSWVDVVGHHHHQGHGGGEQDDDDRHVNEDDDGDGDGDDDDDGVVPPHEYIAKKLARSQISSFSVCEGMGRTLKGRDLRKVRNAILTRTGFLE